MERAGSFTAVPGLGGLLMGLTAFVAALAASRRQSAAEWLGIWVTEMAVALTIGVAATVLKARRTNTSVLTDPGRKFLASFAPSIICGALLTMPLFNAGLLGLLAGAWLLLYGVAVIAGGVFSVRAVPAMGCSFLMLGAVALYVPSSMRDVMLAAGFGGLHVIFGFWIWRRYGG